MSQKCTVSAVLAAILTITASAALAAPTQRPDETVYRPTVPTSDAERFQNRLCRREAPWRIPGPDVRCGAISE